ncbi:hypothetical protein B0A48_11403 [Cryoendolithus antarcticus]|uniref:C2H2-type domain-containing protein n=1 Tax=Cryoendolithus antarcticus TaxID=1507870 RepID=A0A1V8SVY1_9PEZI|nr:hypothetical protein B0A48_11403 [Cryoendolithus antarcticus]
MDQQTVAQTVAQAVQAATQAAQAHAQAQQQQQAASPPAVQSVSSVPTSAVDNLTCQWQGCGERTDNPESLYDHVCERHVGRKSTNNLNLTCQWGACRTTTVKRDHITSHIRVHVPLKPHKCDFCGKAFKRPQDLKKHVKTHADDSVLMNSPQPGANRSVNGGNGGLGQQNGKREYQPHHPSDPDAYLAARLTASNYYGGHDGGMNPYPTYQPSMANGGTAGHFQPHGNQQYAGYGAVSYPNNAMTDIQSMDTRRRAIEALNDFLGDIKRRAIDPTSYYDVGQRLQSNSLPLPVATGSGYNTGYNNQTTYGGFNTASLIDAFSGGGNGNSMGGGNTHGGPMLQHGYSLPLPNARSKNDLQDIDRFLEQLQATVYETSNSAAASGVQHPGVHSQFTGDFGFGNNNPAQFRSSHSPPNMQYGGSATAGAAMSSVGNNMPGLTSSASALDTPALTPASVSSYSSSGHSPMSSHGGRSSMGSMSGNALYPSLPSVTGISDLGSGYPTTTSAPASGLASGYDGMDGRRYSGGRLQRQAPAGDTEMADAPLSDGARTPKQSDVSRSAKSKGNSSIDPALRGEDEKSPSESAGTPAAISTEGDDKRQEEWVENIRVIEALRKWISERLERGEFDGSPSQEHARSPTGEGAAREDQGMADVKSTVPETEERDQAAGAVSYPSLVEAA